MQPHPFLVGAALIVLSGLLSFVGVGVARAEGANIDVHMHLHPQGLPGGQRQAGPGPRRPPAGARQRPGPGGPRPPPRDGGGRSKAQNLAAAADNLVAKMDELGVGRALVVVVPTPGQSGEDDYRDIRRAVGSHSDRLFLMAGGATLGPMIQQTAPDRVTERVRARFRARAEKILEQGAVGFGEMISYHLCMSNTHSFQQAAADHPLFFLLADIAAANDVPIDIHMEAVETEHDTPENLRGACRANPLRIVATVPGLEKLLSHNRDARIVWQHIGWDNVGQMRPALLRRLLESHPNLFLALRIEDRRRQVGGGGPMPNRIVDRRGQIQPGWRDLIVDFSDRVMIGSDEFFSPNADVRHPAASFVGTWAVLDQLQPDLAVKIGHDNPARVYRLDR